MGNAKVVHWLSNPVSGTMSAVALASRLSLKMRKSWGNDFLGSHLWAVSLRSTSFSTVSQMKFVFYPQPYNKAICPMCELPSRHLAVQVHEVWLHFRGTYLYISHTYFLRASFPKAFHFFFKPSCAFFKSFHIAFLFSAITVNLALKAGSISLLQNKYRMP